jgi:hypothetical protein
MLVMLVAVFGDVHAPYSVAYWAMMLGDLHHGGGDGRDLLFRLVDRPVVADGDDGRLGGGVRCLRTTVGARRQCGELRIHVERLLQAASMP